jgi:hypothetical protein
MKNLLLLFIILVVSCTDNQRAKEWGGSATIDLPVGQKLFDVTWKSANLWYATRPMREGESPERYTFAEDSSWGLMEGIVIFQEHK